MFLQFILVYQNSANLCRLDSFGVKSSLIRIRDCMSLCFYLVLKRANLSSRLTNLAIIGLIRPGNSSEQWYIT